MPELHEVLAGVGPRLRSLRRARAVTLAQLAEETGISLSTLSRLESGRRKPTLELLLPLAKAYGVPLDELVGAPATGDHLPRSALAGEKHCAEVGGDGLVPRGRCDLGDRLAEHNPSAVDQHVDAAVIGQVAVKPRQH